MTLEELQALCDAATLHSEWPVHTEYYAAERYYTNVGPEAGTVEQARANAMFAIKARQYMPLLIDVAKLAHALSDDYYRVIVDPIHRDHWAYLNLALKKLFAESCVPNTTVSGTPAE